MEEKRKCEVVRPPRRHRIFVRQWIALLFIFAFFQLLPLSESLNFSRYKEALTKSLLYFEAQRSGHLPYNQRLTWRHHSGLTDGLEQGVDLVGGYYDAGDNVKFGLPMAFTITMLSWTVIQYREEIIVAGEFQHVLEAIKWGTDYFIKAHPHPHVLWVQLFEFGDKFRGKYDSSIGVAKGYYPSVSGYMDELLWGALWLYKATDKVDYLNYAMEKAHSFGGITWSMIEFSWDVKYAGVQIIAAMLPVEEKNEERNQIVQEYRSKAEYYICACLNKNNLTNINRTPGGLLYIREWNNIQYVSTATFLLMAYSVHLQDSNKMLNCHGVLAGPDEISSLAKSQVDYILGSNPMALSYLVGYGSRYPQRVHHRGASVESYKNSKGFIGCTQGYDNWYGREEPNPNILVGALVGGPDGTDQYRDGRENYMQTEACTYNVAPLVGVFAKLHALEQSSSSIFYPPLVSSS